MKKRIDSIDLFKFIAAALIFSMHCQPFSAFGRANFILELAARWGVPFFFFASAYFLFKKSVGGNISKKQFISFAKRIAFLYGLWFIFNLPSIFYSRLYGKDLSLIQTWMLFIKDSVLSSSFTGSWFLASCIFSSFFVFALCKRFQTKTVLIFSFALYILCILSSAYYGLLPQKLTHILDFLCFPLNIFNGCFYFALGKFIAENESRIMEKYSSSRALAYFVLAYLTYILEIAITKYLGIFGSTDVAFGIIPAAFFLFVFCLHIDKEIKHAHLLRKLSIIIFCCQGNVLVAKGIFGMLLGIGSSLVNFLTAVAMVVCVSALVLFVQKRKLFSWAVYLT